MATVTTNFNFPIPQSTDLVKDGATAIAALGTAIDTDFVDLKGGTTGQVLSKASGTDLDFTWVAQDDSNAIQNAIVDAKGDLIAATAADTPARLAVGTNGQVLTADSTASTGLSWATPSSGTQYVAGKNRIINGDFGIWQRGTSITSTSGSWIYGADRFQSYMTTSSGNLVISQQTFTPGTAPVSGYEGTFFLRATAPTTGTSGLNFRQSIEDVRTFAGLEVTFSFWAKASATTAGKIKLSQNFGSGGSATVDSSLTSVSFTTSWARYSMTVTLGSMSGKTIGTSSFLDAYYYTDANFSSAATIDFWGWQVEVASTASTFQTASGGSKQGELAMCQRYYHRFSGEGQATAALINSGLGFSTTVAMFIFHLGTTMRIGPTSMEVSNQGIYRPANATAYSGGTWSLNQGFDNSVRVIYTHGSAIFTAGESLIPSSTTTSNYFAFSAEL